MTTVRDVSVKLKGLKLRARSEAPKAVVQAMASSFQRGVVTNELSRYSHPAGTRTMSPPGQPPARVSGNLARSVKANPPISSGMAKWSQTTGARTVYARIQELGGLAGRHHSARLPARPYLAPAVRRLVNNGTLSRVATQTFLRVMDE